MTYTLVLLRHGESDWNAKNLFTGWVDVALTDKGRVSKGMTYDFALLPGVPAQQLRHRIDEIISLAAHDLNADLGVAMTVFSPQDLF